MQKITHAEAVGRAEAVQCDDKEQELLPLLHTSTDVRSRNMLLAGDENGNGAKMTGYGSIADNADNI